MISFIDEHRSVLGVEPICRLLPIAPSTYYEVVAKRTDVDRLSARERNDIAMKVEIRRVFNENFQVYGVRKVWRQLQREAAEQLTRAKRGGQALGPQKGLDPGAHRPRAARSRRRQY